MYRLRRNIPWTEEEIQYLIDHFDEKGLERVERHLEGRTGAAIQSQVTKLRKEGLIKKAKLSRKWTKEEEDYLLKNFRKLGKNILAQKLGRTRGAVDVKYYSLLEAERMEKPRKEKTSEESRDYGIGREIPKVRFEIGQIYLVKPRIPKGCLFTTFKGKLIGETKDFITLHGKWIESFLKKDFLTGEYEIKEIRS